jgi:hypothetical protein
MALSSCRVKLANLRKLVWWKVSVLKIRRDGRVAGWRQPTIFPGQRHQLKYQQQVSYKSVKTSPDEELSPYALTLRQDATGLMPVVNEPQPLPGGVYVEQPENLRKALSAEHSQNIPKGKSHSHNRQYE